jgi:hypothetical protein
MVSITVLAMLGGLVMQLMGSASKLTSTSKLSSDCDTEARYALNQIAADLAHRVAEVVAVFEQGNPVIITDDITRVTQVISTSGNSNFKGGFCFYDCFDQSFHFFPLQ